MISAFVAAWPATMRAGLFGIRKKRTYATSVTATNSTAAHSIRRTRYLSIRQSRRREGRRLDRRRPPRSPTPSSSLLLDVEGVEVGACVRGLEEVAASPLRHELTLVAVVVRRPRSVVLGDHDVEVAVSILAGRARLQVGSREQLVHLRDVEVRQVVVVL